MTAVFPDTGFLVAVTNTRDALHVRAKAAGAVYAGPITTTEFVLLEVANFFSGAAARAAFGSLLARCRSDPLTEVVPASSDLFARGAALFATRLVKDWSLTDCTSFVLMRERGLTDALTADRHFIQAGFRALLASAGPP